MTINIGINLGHYIILGADTRSVYCWGNKIIRHSDEHQKIQKTKIGLITGAGYTDLLDDVKRQIAEQDIEHTDQIIDIIRKCRENLSVRPFFPVLGSKWIEGTSWLLTYMTVIHDSRVLRLALIHRQFDDKVAFCENNKSCVIMPADSTPEESEHVTSIVNSQVKPLEDLTRINENISYHVTLIRGVIKAVSENHKSVSRSFQIGAHTVDGRMGISGITENGAFSLSLS